MNAPGCNFFGLAAFLLVILDCAKILIVCIINTDAPTVVEEPVQGHFGLQRVFYTFEVSTHFTEVQQEGCSTFLGNDTWRSLGAVKPS